MNLDIQYRSACAELGGSEHVLTCLRRHFADICSDGDVVVHKLLESLAAPSPTATATATAGTKMILAKYGGLGDIAAATIASTLQNWRFHKRCIVEPWWAS